MVNEQTKLVDDLIIRAERDTQRADTQEERAERCESLRMIDVREDEKEDEKARKTATRKRIIWTVVGVVVGGAAGWTAKELTDNN